MANATPFSFDWLTVVSEELKKTDAIPLLGSPPPFPWEKFALQLSHQLQGLDLKIEAGCPQWCLAEDVWRNIDSPQITVIGMAKESAKAYWGMSHETVRLLFSILLGVEREALDGLDSEYLAAFYRFTGLEVLYALGQISYEPALGLHITDIETYQPTEALCSDIAIYIGNRCLYGRIVFSKLWCQALQKRYRIQWEQAIQSSALASQVKLPIHAEIGRIAMTQRQWAGVKSGDFIVLDSCSLNADEDKKTVLLTFRNRPLYRALLKNEGTLKILPPS